MCLDCLSPMIPLFSPDGENYYYTWDLWDLTDGLPVQMVAVEKLAGQLDKPHWDGELSARDVLAAPYSNLSHCIRMARANTSYPILLLEDTGEVLDGMHRLAKTWALGKSTIKVRAVPREVIERCSVF